MSSINRITGLATGIDTESMIEQLMSAQRKSVESLERDKTSIEWQREALLDVNSKLLAFRSEALNMKLQGTYKSYTANSSSPKNVMATATTEAQEGNYRITVKQLATQTTLTGETKEQKITSAKIRVDEADISGKEFNVTYNGETKTIRFGDEGNIAALVADPQDRAEAFRSLLQSKLDDAFGAGQIEVNKSVSSGKFSVSFSSANALSIPLTISESGNGESALGLLGIEDGESTAFNTSQTLDDLLVNSAFTNDQVTISVNGKEFTFNRTDTLSNVFDTLNKDLDIDINIRYSNSKQQVIVNRDSYGDGRILDLGGSEKFWNKLGIKITDSTFMAQNFVNGQNAIFDMSAPDGETAEDIAVSSNNFSYGGISMTFLEADENTTVSIAVSKNVDEIYGKIEGFVNSYNELLTTLNKYYKEEKSGYEPLTDSDREKLSDKQQEQWEAKAKQGILRRDSTLQTAISEMRAAVTSVVSSSEYSSLFQIGISTNSYDSVHSENNGKLVIDSEKLKQSIKDNIEGVTGLFANTASLIQGGKIDTSNMNSISGKSFSINYAGQTLDITFDRNFDFSSNTGVNEFEDYLKNKISSKFGDGLITVSFSNGRILFNSNKGVDLQLNAGANDALTVMGIKDGAKYDSAERGFAVKTYDICTNAMNSIINKAGVTSNIVDNSTLGQALKRKKEAINKMEVKLQAIEDRYYKQFAAMEDALSKMNSQSESLLNMLNSNG